MSEKLTDAELAAWERDFHNGLLSKMARELLAYRRAPAAPATPARDDLRAAVALIRKELDDTEEWEKVFADLMAEYEQMKKSRAPRLIRAAHVMFGMMDFLGKSAALRDAGGTDGN